MKWPFVSRKRHEAEIAHLDAKLMESLDPKLMGINFQDGCLDIGLQGGISQVVAAAFCEQFKASGAKNYLEISFNHSELGRVVVTIQRSYGIRPTDALRELQDKYDALLASKSLPC